MSGAPAAFPDLVVLGATGSVGSQALDVARAHSIRVRGLSARANVRAMESAARAFSPDFAVLDDERAASDLRQRLADTSVRVLRGADGVRDMLGAIRTDNPMGVTAVNAVLGKAGLSSTLETLRAGHRLALANKESLVIAGDLVMALAAEKGTEILPVDSEHSAIFQCLRAGSRREVRRILLTASGGPFFGYDRRRLRTVTKEQTLSHPTWRMGRKITVDSATLMNKGFEVIEAAHLFGVRPDRVEVLVHRESLVHSMVEFQDRSIIAQISTPDMRHCVLYALTHPRRAEAAPDLPAVDLCAVGRLTFARPDEDAFPLLPLARRALEAGGALPAVLNAADEEVVAAFLDDRIRFCDIPDLVARTVDDLGRTAAARTYGDIMEADALARETARRFLNR